MKKALNKIFSLLLTVCLLAGMIPLTGAAAPSGCTHSCQTAEGHLADCSYVEGAECRHVHDEYCEWEDITESEATQSDATRSDAEQIVCNHFCDDDCGYIEAVPCDHVCDENCGGLTLNRSGRPAAVTIFIEEDEDGGPMALYLTEGVEVTDNDLLAGVSAVDENGEAVTVTVKDVGGLDMQNPAIPEGQTFPAISYTITCQAVHPDDAEVTATAAREAYVTAAFYNALSADVIINLAIPGASGTGWEISGNTIWIKDPDNSYTLTGDADGDYRVWVGAQANDTFTITLDDATIDAAGLSNTAFGIESGCTVNLTLTGANTLNSASGYAGLQVPSGTTLTIDGTGSLTANGNTYGAGIGGGANSSGGIITINGGTVTATGGAGIDGGGGAGIGGGGASSPGAGGTGGNITINGGTVTATGGASANVGGGGAGIGGGGGYLLPNSGGAGGTITISGGTVIATGGASTNTSGGGAGIGGGGGSNGGDSGHISITGDADVTALGGNGGNSSGNANNGGAGIGSGGARDTGSAGDVDTITIDTTGTVTATGGNGGNSTSVTGGNGGAGIGTGGTGSGGGGNTGTIIIQSNSVTATGGTGGTGDTGNGGGGASIGAGGGGTGGGEETAFKTITATAGAGGRISPSGAVQVTEGRDITFTITPDSGYSIASVKVDNADNLTAVSSGSHTFANVTGTHTIAAAFAANPSLTLSASPSSSLTLPGNVTLTATLTGAAGGNGGHSITFTGVGSSPAVTTNTSGVATYTFTSPNPGTYSFGASFAGDANNNATTATAIIGYTVDRGAQAALSITGLGNSYTYGNATFNLSTSGGSGGGAVSYTSSNPGVASVSNTTVTIHKAGMFTITATKEADSNYAAKSVTSGPVTVSVATPNVSLDAAGGSDITAPIVLTATVSAVGTGTTPSGTVTFSEGGTTLAANVPLDTFGVAAYTVNNPTAGSHTYTATYSGQTDYYNTNHANRTVGVGLADQSALFVTDKPTMITYGDNVFTLSTSGGDGSGAVTFSAPANNVLTVTSGGTVTITGAGTTTVTATKAADDNYNQATATLSITVAPRDIDNVAVTVLDEPHVYTGSQLQPVFDVADGGIAITTGDYTNAYGANIDARIDGGSVTLTGQGNYAGTKTVTFDIEKRSLTGAVITLAAGPYIYTGSAVTPAVTSIVTGGITVPASEHDVSYTNNTSVGTATVTVTAKAASTNFMGSESTTFIINAPTTYALTITAGTGGSITAGTGGSYAQGDVINIAAGANRYYRFSGWTSSNGGSFGDADSAGTTFTMPGNATMITASFTYTGSSSSSDDSDSYSYTPTTTYPVTVMTTPGYPSTARTTLTTLPDENNALAFTITKDIIQQALDKAKAEAERQGHESYGYALEFDFNTTAGIDSLNITFNADALALLESSGIKETAVTTNAFRFRLDLAAIMEINRQSGGKAVTVSAARFSNLSDEARAYIGSRPAWDITVSYKNGDKTENISNFGKGVITLGMKYIPASNEITDNLAVVYVPGGGNPQILTNSSYDNGWMIWQRSDLAVCGVGYITPDTVFTDTENH